MDLRLWIHSLKNKSLFIQRKSLEQLFLQSKFVLQYCHCDPLVPPCSGIFHAAYEGRPVPNRSQFRNNLFFSRWVCLCAWWVARVGLSWAPDKMRSLSSVLHVCAWGLPAAQTVAALVRRDVDSDDLTGREKKSYVYFISFYLIYKSKQ